MKLLLTVVMAAGPGADLMASNIANEGIYYSTGMGLNAATFRALAKVSGTGTADLGLLAIRDAAAVELRGGVNLSLRPGNKTLFIEGESAGIADVIFILTNNSNASAVITSIAVCALEYRAVARISPALSSPPRRSCPSPSRRPQMTVAAYSIAGSDWLDVHSSQNELCTFRRPPMALASFGYFTSSLDARAEYSADRGPGLADHLKGFHGLLNRQCCHAADSTNSPPAWCCGLS